MPHFVVHAIDRPGASALRAELREGHRARLRAHDHPVRVRVAGPLLADDGSMAGTMMVLEAPDRAAAEAYLAGDPYVARDLFARLEIRGFAWGIGAPEPPHG